MNEQLAKLISQLEAWQNRYHAQLLVKVGHGEINSAKSKLLRILNALEAE